jgi:hypothetical protein
MHVGMGDMGTNPYLLPDRVQENGGIFYLSRMLEAGPAQAAIEFYNDFIHLEPSSGSNVASFLKNLV